MGEALQARSTDWPGKSQLVANLGLYELLDGLNDDGLARLHEAQAAFEAQAQWGDLAECCQPMKRGLS